MLIAEIEALEKSNQTLTERAVDAVTRFCGSIQFVWVNVFGYSLWIGLNQTHVLRLDHAPYSLLGLIIALEAILLSTFILMTENRQQKLSERRNHLNLQMTLLAEQQNTMILQMLLSIQSRLGIHDEQETTAVMLESAEPSNVIQQIQEIIEGDEKAQTSVS